MSQHDVQEKLPFVAIHGNFGVNPQDILRRSLQQVIDRYDFVIIDCPPSLGIVTKNGLRFSTHYVIPTIPDIVSTWGIFQIVSNIALKLLRQLTRHGVEPSLVRDYGMERDDSGADSLTKIFVSKSRPAFSPKNSCVGRA